MQQNVSRHLKNKHLQTLLMLLLSEKEILKVCIHNMRSDGVVLKHNKQLTHSSNNTSDFSTLPPPPLSPHALLPAFIVNYNKDHV